MNAAVADSNSKLPLTWIVTSDTPDTYAVDGWYGNTEWCGLAELGVFPDGHIDRGAIARYNLSCSETDNWFIQGVFCQEIAHLWGQGHHNFYSCMAIGYYPGEFQSSGLSGHDTDDFWWQYGGHQ